MILTSGYARGHLMVAEYRMKNSRDIAGLSNDR